MTTTLTSGASETAAIAPVPLLRRAWAIDAIGSAGVGLAMALGAAPIGGWTGIAPQLLLAAALGFVPYVGLLGWLATRATVPVGVAWLPVVLNAGYAIACVAFLATFDGPTAPTAAFVGVHIAWAALFAELQYVGLRRSRLP